LILTGVGHNDGAVEFDSKRTLSTQAAKKSSPNRVRVFLKLDPVLEGIGSFARAVGSADDAEDEELVDEVE